MTPRHIYYLCPDQNTPTGGILKCYQHVDYLNSNGFSAFVYHSTPNFHIDWFDQNTPVAYPNINFYLYLKKVVQNNLGKYYFRKWDIRSMLNSNQELYSKSKLGTKTILPPLSKEDIIVIPEFIAHDPSLKDLNLPTVVFNQGAYLTFNSYPRTTAPTLCKKENDYSIYNNNHLLGILSISEDTTNYLQHIYPDIPLFQITSSVNSKFFHFQDVKKKQISYILKKNQKDSLQVLKILKERGNLKKWEITPLHNIPQNEVGRKLRNSALFLTFSTREGFGLPPLEAMISGCTVIGYHGQGGREFIKEPYAYPIEDGNIIEFVKTIEKVALDFDMNQNELIKKSERTSKHLQEMYSEKREKKVLLQAWGKILDSYSKLMQTE